MTWYEYALIKYMPNPKRGEIINIGLIVFNEKKLDIRMIDSVSRLNILEEKPNLESIALIPQLFNKLTKFSKDNDSKFNFLKKNINGIFLSEKAIFSVNESEKYEDRVLELYNELIKLPKKKKNISDIRIQTKLKKKFEELKIFSNDVNELINHKVLHNYSFDESNPDFVVDFILKNGNYHLTETIDFNLHNRKEKLKEASFKSIILAESKNFYGDELGNRFFVYSATSKKESEITTSLNIIKGNCDEIFNLDSKEDEEKYLDKILSLVK